MILKPEDSRSFEYCYYYGKSLVSRTIECFTWGHISHVAIRNPYEAYVVEAWQPTVQRVADISFNHTERTRVDVYALDLTPQQFDVGVAWLDQQVGRLYDFRGVLSFLLRRNIGTSGAWFCSELGLALSQIVGKPLLCCPPFKATPTVLSYSPVQRFVGTEYTEKP